MIHAVNLAKIISQSDSSLFGSTCLSSETIGEVATEQLHRDPHRHRPTGLVTFAPLSLSWHWALDSLAPLYLAQAHISDNS